MRLENRIALLSVVLMLGLLFLVNTGIYLIFAEVGEDAELNDTLQQARSIAEAVPQATSEDEEPANTLSSYLSGDSMIRVVDPDENTLISVTTESPSLNQLEERYSAMESAVSVVHEGSRYAVARVPVVWSDGEVVTLEIATSMQSFAAVKQILLIVLILSGLIAVIPVILAGKALGRSLAAPVMNLTEVMRETRLKGGFRKLETRRKRKDEIAELEEAYNHMITLLENNDRRQRQFISDASHELKTPLTVIHSYARLLERQGKERPELVDEAAASISGEATRLQEMMKQMLALATGEDTVVEKEPVEITDVIRNTVSGMQLSTERAISLQEQNCNEGVMILANKGQIRQLAYILLENALKYSEEAIQVRMTYKDEQLIFQVEDRGIGIPESALEHIFDRFYRVDEARVRKNGGSGLGLAIAARIAKQHQAQIDVDSDTNRGSVFTVRFPVMKEGTIQ